MSSLNWEQVELYLAWAESFVGFLQWSDNDRVKVRSVITISQMSAPLKVTVNLVSHCRSNTNIYICMSIPVQG